MRKRKPPSVNQLHCWGKNRAVYEALQKSHGMTIEQLRRVGSDLQSRAAVTSYLWRVDKRLKFFGWRIAKIGLTGKNHLYRLIEV